MGEARGLGGRRVRLAARPSPLRLRLPRPPAPPLVVLPLIASALKRYARALAITASAFSAFRLFRRRRPRLTQMASAAGRKSLRARAPAPCAPPCGLGLPSRGAGVGGRPLQQAPAIPFFGIGGGWLFRGHSAAAAPFAGQSCGQYTRSGGGLVGAACGPPPAPLGPSGALQPRPPFWGPRGGAYFIALRGFRCGGLDIVAAASPGHYMLWC